MSIYGHYQDSGIGSYNSPPVAISDAPESAKRGPEQSKDRLSLEAGSASEVYAALCEQAR